MLFGLTVRQFPSNIVTLTIRFSYGCAIDASGNVYHWGRLNNGAVICQPTLMENLSQKGIKQVTFGSEHCLAWTTASQSAALNTQTIARPFGLCTEPAVFGLLQQILQLCKDKSEIAALASLCLIRAHLAVCPSKDFPCLHFHRPTQVTRLVVTLPLFSAPSSNSPS